MTQWLEWFDEKVWGLPMIFIIIGLGLYLSIRLKGLQLRRLPLAMRYMLANEEDGEGEISSFGALCTSLSATIGTGNIVGVATAICVGGPGALFWMWLAALVGMCTKFAEGVLAIKYRVFTENGKALGGPFYYIQKGMGEKYKWLAKLFAFFACLAGLLGIGTITQITGITTGFQGLFDKELTYSFDLFGMKTGWITVIVGLVVTASVAFVLIGGVKRIASVSEKMIPAMVVMYIALCLFVILFNIKAIPSAFAEIFSSAFGLKATTGGAIGAMFVAMQKGVARGIFSNEAGLGSAPIAAAAAKTNEPVRQGLVSMTAVFIDTIIVCTMTGLSIVLTGAWKVEGLQGSAVTIYAFQNALPINHVLAGFLLILCLALFAYSTILGWNYYAERCLAYLTNNNEKASKIFRYCWIAAVFVGPYLTVSQVWTLADIFNGLMAFPNLLALAVLSPVVIMESKSFFNRLSHDGFNTIVEPKVDEVNDIEISTPLEEGAID
ncbi:alanine/glycine:cation symporter family protein [Pilibacter termitis]|uniref:alanine/glycine:cation symporter family protein n=1 Tax=Pilibacter termitis TaxID=263852 RepID=UPI00389AF706